MGSIDPLAAEPLPYWITADEAGRRSRTSAKRVRAAARDGELTAVRLGRRWLTTAEAVDCWLRGA